MKISPPAPRAAAVDRPVAQAPIGITDMGTAALVLAAPTTEAAWIALTERLPRNGATLACRLFVTSERVDQATAAVAKGLAAIGEKRRAGEAVPASWVDRLADLVVAEFDALTSWDDAAHSAGHVPAWVEVPPGERAISPSETSWARLSRIVAREISLVGGMELSDQAYAAWCALDATRPCEGSDLAAVTDGCRRAIRAAVTAHYGQQETGR